MYDVIVVGGGTSGLMASVKASSQGAKTLLLEKKPEVASKLLLTGGGRCNVTNRSQIHDLIKHVPGNGKFLYSALTQFGPDDIISFFKDLGVELVEEDHGRMFPTTNKSLTIKNALLDACIENKVDIKTRITVDKLLTNEDSSKVIGVKDSNDNKYYSKAVILALGGASYPGTGSTGDGYLLCKDVGHTIAEIYPTEVALTSSDEFIKDRSLQGISLDNALVSSWSNEGKLLCQQKLPVIFTHFGLSGPGILRSSGHVNYYMKETGTKSVLITLDLIPDISKETLKDKFEENREQSVGKNLKEFLPERLVQVICTKFLQQESQTLYKQLVHKQQDELIKTLKEFPVNINGSLPIEKAFVTGGGVNVNEVDPSTMASKLIDGLYICGELLDINGYTGGYNITCAFSTGVLAGEQAAWYSYTV